MIKTGFVINAILKFGTHFMEGANIGSIKALMPSKVSNPHGNFEVIDRWSVGVAHFLELIYQQLGESMFNSWIEKNSCAD